MALLATLVVIVYLLTRPSGHPVATGPGHAATGATATSKPSPSPVGPQRLVVQPESWLLPTPLSRAVALADGSQIRLLGGLGPQGVTTPNVAQIDPATGQATPVGTLADPVHDAAGAVLGGRDFVFGGGATTVVSTVQALSSNASAGAASTRTGTLPAPRADLSSATVGGKAIIVGGYDGAAWSPDVLETSDGTTFQVLTKLPQPVRYAAVAAVGQRVYVIGGELPSGGDATTIQMIDLRTHTATVVGQLPLGLSHAGAAVIGGGLYLFGGRAGGHAVDTISKLDLSTYVPQFVARLPVAASDMALVTVGSTLYLLGGENDAGTPIASVAQASLGPALQAGAPPFDGHLLIADRGNNRLLLVDPAKTVSWMFPSPTAPAPPEGFYFPDDAFFAKSGTAIITNEEDQNTIIMLAYPSGKVLASYGHAGVAGVAPGYLNQPDDAYLLRNGGVTVADAKNCRIVFLTPSFTYAGEIGRNHRCVHNPPNDIAYPNGDTPLANGDFLVSEINGSYVDELRPDGSVVWSTHLAITYPSDPQQLGPDLYLIADYAKPGGLYEFTRNGTIVWSYSFASGEQALDHPSLAEQLPNGFICVNDDYRDRVVIIDPVTKTIVWQYGQTDLPGTGPNQLKIPDGFDLLAPNNTTPTHPQTG